MGAFLPLSKENDAFDFTIASFFVVDFEQPAVANDRGRKRTKTGRLRQPVAAGRPLRGGFPDYLRPGGAQNAVAVA